MIDRLHRSPLALSPTLLAPIVAPILALMLAGPVRAQGDEETQTNYSVANQLEFYYDTKLEETVLDNRLDAAMSRGHYRLGATFLSHSPSNPALVDPNGFGVARQGIRKRWFEANYDDGSVRVGDVYATLGRGLALAIFEDQTVDFDNGIDGVSGRAVFGDAEIKFLGGSGDYEFFGGLTDCGGLSKYEVKGAEARWDVTPAAHLGAEGVWSDRRVPDGARFQGDRLGGGNLSGSLGNHLDYYGEYVHRNNQNYGSEACPELSDGHAGYANLSAYLGRLQLLGEFKDLLRYNLPFVNPPTAVRTHNTTLLNRGGHTPNIRKDDERGGLLEAIYSVNDETRLTGAFSRSEARKSHQPAWEAYGELETWFGAKELLLRAAETEEIVIEGVDEIYFERVTAVGSVLWPLDDTYSLDMTFETQDVQEQNRTTQDFQQPQHFRNNLFSGTLHRSPNLSLALVTEWTGDKTESKDSWIWGECNLRLGDRHQLLLGVGSIRGGQLCSGGVCKIVEPFEGGRLELLTTF